MNICITTFIYDKVNKLFTVQNYNPGYYYRFGLYFSSLCICFWGNEKNYYDDIIIKINFNNKNYSFGMHLCNKNIDYYNATYNKYFYNKLCIYDSGIKIIKNKDTKNLFFNKINSEHYKHWNFYLYFIYDKYYIYINTKSYNTKTINSKKIFNSRAYYKIHSFI